MNALSTPSLDLLRGATMGTSWSVQLHAPARDLHALHAQVQQQLDRVVAQMSTWEPDSDISRFNRGVPGWFALPSDFYRVLECALLLARDSDGAFDPTIGGLVGLWGFGAHAQAGMPTVADMQRAMAVAGWRNLQLDPEARAAWQPGGLQLDLSAIAKGYGVDLVSAALRDTGVAHALVEVGGELRALGGKPDGGAWRVLAEAQPDEDDDSPTVLQLRDCAVATSGDRWHRQAHGGIEYAHTLDPRTGRPLPRAPMAVTVIAGDAMLADGWATALSVLGAHAGLALADAHGLAARFVLHAGNGATHVHSSAAFAAFVAP